LATANWELRTGFQFQFQQGARGGKENPGRAKRVAKRGEGIRERKMKMILQNCDFFAM
jgi:hypothetical protein